MGTMQSDDRRAPSASSTRSDLVEVAAQLLRERGPEGVTTRAVAQAAGVQAPTIYRLFGDKDGLLDAVAEHVFATYVSGKARAERSADPVADLRAGWDTHVDFGLANPGLFGLLVDPKRSARSPAVTAGRHILRGRIQRVAEAGRLRIPEEHAVDLVHAAGTGTVLTLLAQPPSHRDRGLADTMYDAVARVILTDVPALDTGDATAAIIGFRTLVPALALTDAERELLSEWLTRAVGG